MFRRKLVTWAGVLLLGFVVGAATTYTAERHEEIRAAQRDLAHAVERLNHGAHDFGSHRARAIEYIHRAQDELRDAIGFDRH